MTTAVIGGRRYDTRTAMQIGLVGSRASASDDSVDWSATLYRTGRGAFFLSGYGGSMDQFAARDTCGGSDSIVAISTDPLMRFPDGIFEAEMDGEYPSDLIKNA